MYRLTTGTGRPKCTAVHCSSCARLTFTFNGHWCPKHLPVITALRSLINHKLYNDQEYWTRLQELTMRKWTDFVHFAHLRNRMDTSFADYLVPVQWLTIEEFTTHVDEPVSTVILLREAAFLSIKPKPNIPAFMAKSKLLSPMQYINAHKLLLGVIPASIILDQEQLSKMKELHLKKRKMQPGRRKKTLPVAEQTI